eukprot:scaffold18505_cov73-Skeletonema_marinoi.AAC.1
MAAWCSHNTTPSFQFSIKFLQFCKYKRGRKSLALECHMLCRLCLLRWARYDSVELWMLTVDARSKI